MEFLGRETVDNIAILTLNHVEKRNALGVDMLNALSDELAELAEDTSVRVVVLRANGSVFSSGHDLREVVANDASNNTALFALCTGVMEAIRALPQPVIAEVHALATAAGLQLVASCDLVIASEQARFATPGVKIGLFCTTPGVALARAIAPKKALELLLTGDTIDAHEAERLGLVNRVVPGPRLHDEAMALAKQIAGASAEIIQLGKRAFYEQLALDRPDAYRRAQQTMVDNAAMPDAQEGMRAFLEKRPPKWR
jgi:enoyl-CoA hydratase/carnithine racemase